LLTNYNKKEKQMALKKVVVGECLVNDNDPSGTMAEIAHIDLLIGPRGSAVETAFCNSLCNNKDGFTSLLAVVGPNLQCKPNTLMFNKVTIKGAKQAVQMFGPAQKAVAMAVQDCVEAGTIPKGEAEDLYVCVGVFIHWEAASDEAIYENNYKATKGAIENAMAGKPSVDEVLSAKDSTDHPFQGF
jgi:5,6,7,8-tetrahydromethanopterin hydro-lyase